MEQKSKRTAAAAIAAILLFYGAAQMLGITVCPLRSAFGLSCPGCGMTRACLAVAKGNFPASFYYHPLWPVVVPTVLVELLNGFGLIKLPKKFNNIWLCIVGGLLLVCYIVRLATNTIVY